MTHKEFRQLCEQTEFGPPEPAASPEGTQTLAGFMKGIFLEQGWRADKFHQLPNPPKWLMP
jgi:hypothetical protein